MLLFCLSNLSSHCNMPVKAFQGVHSLLKNYEASFFVLFCRFCLIYNPKSFLLIILNLALSEKKTEIRLEVKLHVEALLITITTEIHFQIQSLNKKHLCCSQFLLCNICENNTLTYNMQFNFVANKL